MKAVVSSLYSFRPALFGGLLLMLLSVTPASGQIAFEQPPIGYLQATPENSLSRLQEKITSGKIRLEYDEQHGYLNSVLKHLDVPISSQMLVFSKTSFQPAYISPRTPRALYFSDDAYIGWVKGGPDLELSIADPQYGAVFYTLPQRKTDRPQFVRRTHECLQCHSGSRTDYVPGHLIRSVYPDPDGQPFYAAGTHLTQHSSPLKKRWGGWYVTGTHGDQRHLGNQILKSADEADSLDLSQGANITDLSKRFTTSAYLSGSSDIVALMVIEHQTTMHNLLTKAHFLTRIALHDEQILNKFFERPAGHRSDSTKRRIASAAEPAVKHLLFCEEAELTAPIRGLSGFDQNFASRGPRDKQGRSLRDLDLKTRMFKYPCSYLIYSEAFDRLPSEVRDQIYRRLWDVLSGKETGKPFQHLSTADRTAIREILIATKRGLPSYWK